MNETDLQAKALRLTIELGRAIERLAVQEALAGSLGVAGIYGEIKRTLERRAEDLSSAAGSPAAVTEGATLSDIEAELLRASEFVTFVSSRRPEQPIALAVKISGGLALLSALVSLIITSATACANVKKADADARTAVAASVGKVNGPLTLSYADDGVLGDYVFTATLNMTASGGQAIFVNGVDFEPYVGALRDRANSSAEQPMRVMEIEPPKAAQRDGVQSLVDWHPLSHNNSSFPSPSGCWVVERPFSHPADAGACNVNGAGVYDVGESFVASRQWRVSFQKQSAFGVVVKVHWRRENDSFEATPWEFVQTRTLLGRSDAVAPTPVNPACCVLQSAAKDGG